MAAETEVERLVVRLVGDSSGYAQMLRTATTTSTAAARQVEQTTQRVEGLGSGLKGFFGSVAGSLASLGVFSFLSGARSAFEEAERGAIRLRAAIEANGGSVDAVEADYRRFAATIRDITGTGRAEVLSLLQQAEAMGITGDRAKQLVQTSVSLAAAKGGEASEFFRAALAYQTGNTEMLRYALRLRGVKNESEILAAAQRQITAGWKTAVAIGGTASARLDRLGDTFKMLKKEIGGVVVEGLQPAIAFLEAAAKWFADLDPSVKKTVVSLGALTAGLLALGPTLAIVKALLSPLVPLLGLAASAAGALVSPIGLAVASVAALGAAVLYWTDSGGRLLEWFGMQWGKLTDYVRPAVSGVRDAIKAAKLDLAFQVAWAQIQLSFAEFKAWLLPEWYQLNFLLTQVVNDFVADTKRQFGVELPALMAKRWIDEMEKAGTITEEFANQWRKNLFENATKEGDAIRAANEQANRKAMEEANANIKGLQTNLDKLRAERDALVTQAAEAAANLPKMDKMPELGEAAAKSIKKATQELQRFDAALVGSQEANARIRAFRDLVAGFGKSVPTAAPAGVAGAAGALGAGLGVILGMGLGTAKGPAGNWAGIAGVKGGPENWEGIAGVKGGKENWEGIAGAKGEGTKVLEEIREILKGEAKKPKVEVKPANL